VLPFFLLEGGFVMKKITLLMLILIFSLNFVGSMEVQAVGEGVVARVLVESVGERTLAAVAEKAGLKYGTKTAREIAMRRWNKDLYAQVETIESTGITTRSENLRATADYFKKLDDSMVVPIPEKPGFGRILVKSALFLTGADLLVDGYKAIQSSIAEQKLMGLLTEFTEAQKTGEKLLSYKGAGLFIEGVSGSGKPLIFFGYPPTSAGLATGLYNSTYDYTKPYWTEITNTIDYTTYALFNFTLHAITATGAIVSEVHSSVHIGFPAEIPDFNEVGIIPDTSNVPDVNLTPWAQNLNDDVPVPDPTPEFIPVDIPLTNDYPETITEPWNDPYVDLNYVPVPEPEPVPEPNPDGSTPIDDSKCTKPLDMSKIKHLGNVISTSFPFSIPWDIYNAFDSLFGGMSDNGKPDWVFKFSQVGEEFHFSIPDYFDKWMPFIRGIALISWNISLIYALRKWFGGAS
jgi:hypothetical protein